ncbi:uracil-DNA glycosylase [Sulfuricurvum sp.]|uniref:uracil-DNA glycosylase n=1 Tax=Sulfuricurvum sp. TaxID=2025608 RepID=UPI002639D5A7|nr:uracil-DNA glycosylase [Sulfuricurvum sp.]MDD2266618.1 uracil-DNA glycosylase [Sulfuricurvum sp.]MDD2784439.1 uracil-DNA glycosylase [Sulfuricurvum sp.]
MDSFQNLALLENLYRLKSLGYAYIDPITPNIQATSNTLPDSLSRLGENISKCYLCDLSKSRRQSMIGYGNPRASLMFIDAYVSAAEDEASDYYVGRSGVMLRDMIEKVLKYQVEDVYFTHAVKCKPFGFQSPSQSECSSCAPFLSKQIELIKPSIIVTLGSDAYQILTGDLEDFERVRGEIIPFRDSLLIPMYHPLYLVRNPSLKKEALRDLQTIKGQLS